MKKTLTVIAALAIAASAQATLLATWGEAGAADGTANGDYKYLDGVTAIGVTDMSAYNGATLAKYTSSSASYDIRLSNLSKNDGAGLQFGYKVADGNEILDATVSADTIHTTGNSPAKMNWFLGDTTGTAVDWEATSSAGTKAGSWNLGTLSGTGTALFVADIASGKVTASSAAPSGVFDISGNIQLNGTVKEASTIPEPATMSLLGLGALAMVIRRKLRK